MSNIRVIVRLPTNRPEIPLEDPEAVVWNTEKANILWEVIARSRASDSGGTDWKGLAAHLDVPLPYLLYRAQTRYEEDLRGLQDIRGQLSPKKTTTTTTDGFPLFERPRISTQGAGSSGSTYRLNASTRLPTPLGVRARLTSLGTHSKPSSSSTLTLQGLTKLRPATPSSSEGTDSEEEAAAKEEAADKTAEEQETLDKKLRDLQTMMTTDTIGLISSSKPRDGSGKGKDRGRTGLTIRTPLPTQGSLRSSRSHSLSTVSSPGGSIPSIPSPPSSRHLSPHKHKGPSSPPTVSLGQAMMVGRSGSEAGSSQSTTSSFSDISENLSASGLESGLMSNIRGGGSRLSAFARSKFGGKGGTYQ